ncbi:MAG TPA: SDR family oxidoreductase [Solirubrobacterales bacterium]|nr:SDR family oxidoreductase [Solirubrobacterales bacterium]
MTQIAVTGATGAVGGEAARILAGRKIDQRLLVRNPADAPDLPGATVVRSSYGDFETARNALEGTTHLFMVSAAESADRMEQHRTFIDAAAHAGVEHIVYTSFQGASPEAVFTLAHEHFETERHIRASGLRWTFLRDSFYIDFLPMLAGDDGVIRGPAGDGRVAAVTRADVARSAVAVLLDPAKHLDSTYTLTGPRAISMPEVARAVERHSGRPISFLDETIEEAYESRRKWNAPDWQNDAWVSTYTSIAAGEVSEVTGDVKAITGGDPESLDDFLSEAAP